MRVTVAKVERFYIVIEVQQRTFDENTIEEFEKIFDRELDEACKELRQDVKRKFHEIKESAKDET